MKPAIPHRVSTDELRTELEQVLCAHFGKTRRILSLRRRRSPYSSSYTIENLEVDLDRGKHVSLVFKDLSPNALLQAARDVRPDFLYRPQREIETYRSALNSKQLGTPIFYGSVERSELVWLFIERVKGPLLWQVGRFELWKSAARWLAQMHGHFAKNKPADPKFARVLLRFDADHCGRWIKRAERFLSRLDLPREVRWQFEDLARNYSQVLDRILSMPQTLIHGEFYPSNVILRRHEAGRRICPIDWEVAAIGPGLIDLAALVSGSWTLEEKRLLVAAYHQALEPGQDWPPALDEMLLLVNYCQLHLSIQWLGWAPDWLPPKQHEQDWLLEALRLSKLLGLLPERNGRPVKGRLKPVKSVARTSDNSKRAASLWKRTTASS